jgi:predicted aspartyl protease
MPKIIVAAKIGNLRDLYNVEQGIIPTDKVRQVEVRDAPVDTGAILLSRPKRLIAQVGLNRVRTRHMRTSGGPVQTDMYDVVRLTVQGRECTVDVLAVPDDGPVLIGQVPLELLAGVVDPAGRQLIGKPDHGGELMYDQF